MAEFARQNGRSSDSFRNADTYGYRCAEEGDYERYLREIRYADRPKRRKNGRKSFLRFLLSLAVTCLLCGSALTYSFDKLIKGMFVPTPYKEIKTDMRELAFPTLGYLSNTWFSGVRGFGYSASGKKAQMTKIKENVNMPVLSEELSDLAAQYPTLKPAVFVWDYDTGNYVDMNASESYPTASIIKIPVLVDVFKSIEAGQMTLEDTMALTEYYRTEGSGSMQFKARDSVYTVDKLAEKMITESDNSATNMLIAKVGSMTDVNSQIRNWGLKATTVQTQLPDLGGTNRTTAREMATILYNIDENDEFLTEDSRRTMLNYMGHVHNNRLIHAGLGEGAVFLHKTGDIGSMLGDAGIVITPKGKKYIAVILVKRPHNAPEAKEFIVKASEIVYNYMVK